MNIKGMNHITTLQKKTSAQKLKRKKEKRNTKNEP